MNARDVDTLEAFAMNAENANALRLYLLRDEALKILAYFSYEQLPSVLQNTAREFSNLAHSVFCNQPLHPETVMALRKLLEARDCAVRAELAGLKAEKDQA